ncbi:hypothetical protein ACH5RR_029078 [Cinchona calisaya]|uniref:SWIM-type domain-containing protein n=1 Tax=Cinchona calisaya TaxID=153742 RepID=A0ABD2YTW3_9GENT
MTEIGDTLEDLIIEESSVSSKDPQPEEEEEEQDDDVAPRSGEYGRNSELFTLKVHYGGAFTGEIEKNYVGGCLDYFDDCNPIDMKLYVLIHMTNGLGYGTNVGFMYKIPVVNGDFSLRKIEMEDNIVDMAAIGKQNGSVELYITQANNIAFLDSEVGQLGEIAEGHNEDSKGYSGSFNGEEFHDSDYDFCKDDDVIYNQSVATAGRDLSIVLEQIQVNEESEFLNSDELNSIYSSSDEEVGPTLRFVLFRLETDMEDPNLYVGLQFSSKNEYKEAIENHAVKWGKEFRWKKNDSIKMRAVCLAYNCSWFVFASKMADSDIFVIKTMGPSHQCGRTFYHKRVTSTFLSKTYVEFLRLNRKVTVGAFQEKVHRELNANITRHQVYKTFQKAKILIYGKYKKQYSKIWDYYEELLKKNPGSTVDIVTVVDEISGKERFQRMYICFEALKRGFREGCRPVIGVDGCHLRGPYPGILLTAVGIDPNDFIYPIAYAVVEIENKNSWRWFIEHLKYDLEIYDQQSWTFISDRQKGLGSAIHEILPRIEHRHCVRHLHNNFKKLHPGDSLKARVWACARSTYRKRFDNEMESLKQYDEEAHKWLTENTSPYHWSRSHFRTIPNCDILLNNLCESFNSVILEAREKPILGMLENIRMYIMERLRTKREWIRKRTENLCPKIQKKLDGEKFAVDLEKRVCDCRRWELTGIPCSHAVCCISLTGEEPESFVNQCYSKTLFMHLKS